jgi:hypothetical protein
MGGRSKAAPSSSTSGRRRGGGSPARSTGGWLFAHDPDRYAPQFGGFCTGGVGLGRLTPIDPEAWVIIEGRLYLHHDKEGRDETAADPKAHIAAAAERWEALGKAR